MPENSINKESMLRVGTILHGTYCIDRYLSSGGFGNTYVATHVDFDETCAVKEFFMKGVTQRDGNNTTVSVSNREKIQEFETQREKFKKEARRLRKLNNRHIVRVHDLFEENGTAYYVMDYVDGENLKERMMRTQQPLTEDEVAAIIPQVLDALSEVHSKNIWHLDLKPANIMIDHDGTVKLIDFGASKQFDVQKGGATTGTAVSYTNGYAPREQMEQSYEKFGPWTDFYALGATVYNLLTNRRPPMPTDIDDDRSEDKHLALPLPAEISPKMRHLILWLMKTDRLGRPTSVKKIQEFMDAPFFPGAHVDFGRNDVPGNDDTIVEGGEVEMAPPRQSKMLKIVIASCIALAVALGGYYLWSNAQNGKNQVGVENKEGTQFSPIIQNLIDNMVYVEGGTFMMGATSEQTEPYDYEKPVHQVTLSSFSIGKYEVTQEEWQEVMGTNPSVYKGKKHPVESVTWEMCQEFISKLNQLTGKRFRLPTEAEWEYAARGGNKSRGYVYAGSNNIGVVAWYDDNSGEKTHEVGQKQPNELGLYDMAGNICEWCSDWYGDYSSRAQTNPTGASSGAHRVFRGGGSNWIARLCRVSYRGGCEPSSVFDGSGFRLCLSE